MEIILASKSPRRQALIQGIEVPYRVYTYEVDESFPADLIQNEIAVYLAEKKALAYPEVLKESEVLLTADTIVWVNDHVLNKPANRAEAFQMLKEITGTKHIVFTGICLRTASTLESFYEATEVHVKPLSNDEIYHYIDTYKPYDRAGSYGIQDWFGYVAVERINGCFYNVMGLPVHAIYDKLKKLREQHPFL
ncbi:MAG: Maf family nucleotide pyrophosphatase [Bacteroidia bacterium]|jgi:septum formation protein|nr:Maf family nucleotide pyrophosphatase [Bacteroidia bacterium]